MESFTFLVNELSEQSEIIKDENGIHWVEEMSHSHKHGGGAEGSGKKMNGWGVSIYNDGKIFEGVYHDNLPCGVGY